MDFPNEFTASAIKLGKVILESLNPHASHKKRKPFIVTYGLNSDHIRDYLTRGLGWVVHEVSMPNDLEDFDEGSILGQPCPWDRITNFENVSDIKLNRGWLLDTFIEDGGGKGTFLNNVLLIKNAERFLDKDYVSTYGYIGDTLTRFIKDIVTEGPTSIEIPYLKTNISTERLIVIMASGKKNVAPGHGTMNVGALRPLLELRQESKVRSDLPSQPKAEEPSLILETEISEDTCKQMMKDTLVAQNKVLDDKDFNLRWGALHAILSGKSKVHKLDFCCPEAFEFIGQAKNFLDGSVPPKVVNALIVEFVRKKVKASE